MPQIRSFRGRIFTALFAVALIPVVLALWAGTLSLREVVSSAGTAGPWDAVAESGRVLLERVEDSAARDPEVRAAADEHREALSESVRLSHLYAFVAERFLGLLPVIAVILTLLVAGAALLAARHLSRQFAHPIGELVGWTRKIARSEPLPEAPEEGDAGIAEFRALRDALRAMDVELREGRLREIESARLRSWTEMARRVSHELKNPLTPMRMAATAVARMDDRPAAVQAGEVLLEEIDRLDEMARSFAHFGRLPEGPTSEIDLRELLETLVRRHDAGPSKVEISAAPDLPLVRGHYDAMLRVFRNLLVNALEVVNGGRVEVSLREREGGVEVTIQDSGPGIPPELLEAIWTPDFTTKRRGSGLGLPLVRRTVEAYGGTVEAENHAEGGARFTVFLPAEAPS